MSKIHHIKADSLTPLKDKILVTDLETTGQRLTSGGIIRVSEDMQSFGIRQRWCRVWAVGPEIDYVKPGDWILQPHGEWTVGFDVEINGEMIRLWRINNDKILLVSDEDPREDVALPSVSNHATKTTLITPKGKEWA
jgi:co-chaperonin GroES (HSP10)